MQNFGAMAEPGGQEAVAGIVAEAVAGTVAEAAGNCTLAVSTVVVVAVAVAGSMK